MLKYSKAKMLALTSLILAIAVLSGTNIIAQNEGVEVSEEIRSSVPAPLQPWVDWSLRDYKANVCPHVLGQKQCSWTSKLKLETLSDSSSQGVGFSFDLEQLEAGWVDLPGGDVWPSDVAANAQALPVIRTSGGRPRAYLEVGEYKITGDLTWEEQPAALGMPSRFAFDGYPPSCLYCHQKSLKIGD